VNNSPHPYGGVNFTVVRHNAARNKRVVQFNHECWLVMLRFPLDFWTTDYIQTALAPFGRMLMWENDRNHMTRLMVRARVSDLQDAPQFIVVTEAEGFQGESWMVQVEIIEQELLGGFPTDEEPVIEQLAQGNPVPFDFLAWVNRGRLLSSTTNRTGT
jgi:hypothetical protein